MEEGMNGSQVAEKGETLFLTSRRCPQLYPLSTSLNDSLGNSWALGLCSTWGREAQSLNKDYLEELGQGVSKPQQTDNSVSTPAKSEARSGDQVLDSILKTEHPEAKE